MTDCWCFRDSSSSLFRSRRVLPSSAASWRSVTILLLIKLNVLSNILLSHDDTTACWWTLNSLGSAVEKCSNVILSSGIWSGLCYQKLQDILSNDKDFCMKIFGISLKNLSIELQESYRKKICWIFSLFLKNTCDCAADWVSYTHTASHQSKYHINQPQKSHTHPITTSHHVLLTTLL